MNTTNSVVIASPLLTWAAIRYRRYRRTFKYDEFVLHCESDDLVLKFDMNHTTEKAVRKAYWNQLKSEILPRLEERLK